MKKNFFVISAIAILIIIGAYILMNQGGEFSLGEARTYYESLDLSTPEAAVKTFTAAFAREDYPTVYLILSLRGQLSFDNRFSAREYQYLFDIESSEAVLNEVALTPDDPEYFEYYSSWYLFDEVMLAAKKHNAVLIDLSGKITILDSEPSKSERDEETLDVITNVDGIEGEVIFRMVQAPSGRWRVLQVILEDGDDEMVPWAIPAFED